MFEYIEYGCIAIAAFVLAFGEALRREPRVWGYIPYKEFFRNRNWRFVPAFCVTFAAIIWTGDFVWEKMSSRYADVPVASAQQKRKLPPPVFVPAPAQPPPSPSPSPAQSEKHQRHYLQSEKDGVLSALDKLGALLAENERVPDKNVTLVLSLWGKESRGPASSAPNPPTTDQLPAIVDSLKKYAGTLVAMNEAIHTIVNSTQLTKEEVAPLMNGSDASVAQYRSAIYNLVDVFMRMYKIPKEVFIGFFFEQERIELQSAHQKFEQWLHASIKKVSDKTLVVREWK